MNVQVEYTAQLRARAGCDEETFTLNRGTAADVMAAVAERHGAPVREMLFDTEGRVGQSVLAFLDDEQIDWRRPPAIHDEARLTLMSPISGG